MIGVIRNVCVTVALTVVAFGTIVIWRDSLRDPRFLDGWLLVLLIVIQFSYHLRRNSVARTLSTASSWYRLHIYAGYATAMIFLSHTSFSLPSGFVDWMLWIFFVVVTITGLIGLLFAAEIPGKLDLRERGLDYAEVPRAREDLAKQAVHLAEQALANPKAQVLSEYYASDLIRYFSGARDQIQHVRHSNWPLRRRMRQLSSLEKYLDQRGLETLNAFRQLVLTKNELDYQQAQFAMLQAWLFIHVPATYGLVVISLVHIAQVYAFSSGVP